MIRIIALLGLTVLLFPSRAAQAQTTSAPSVESILFGTGIENRELVGTGTTFDTRPDMIYCYTRIVGAQPPAEVFHVWTYNGEEKRRVRLEVGSASWRTWSGRSTEALMAEGEGIWEVLVQTADGEVLGRSTFTIRRADD